jgi:2-hydroxy-6-oxonona-2,4-dienedioate hydrolase
MKRRHLFAAFALALVLVATLLIRSHFERDLALAAERAALGSEIVTTRCGPMEVQQAGTGIPLLMIHGSGGGHDQGMAWARPLVQHGVRVIAMSRFGYLRTPRPADASPAAQADAHVCLLDALGITKAAVMGVSAGGPSALQTAIRHPDRVSALVLIVPIAYKPGSVTDSAPPVSDDKDALLLRLLGSDFLFWAGLHVARSPLIRHVLATPPEQVAAAIAEERARVNDLAERILPLSARAAGLRDDTRLGKRLGPYALESIRVPTLVVSARNDAFGTYAGAQYTANRIPGAKFLGFDEGGHLLVGHDAEVRARIVTLLNEVERPSIKSGEAKSSRPNNRPGSR